MIEQLPLAPGTRVWLAHPSPLLTLRSARGTVLRQADWDPYYIIRLDQPAIFDEGVGEPREITEIVEAADNMEALSG